MNPGSAAQLRIGIIGVGAIARDHLNRIARYGLAKVVGICDLSTENLDLARKAQPELLTAADNYADYRALLGEKKFEAAIICTPHRDHYQQVLDCLGAGLHVLAEKPLANTVSQAKELIEASHATKAVSGIAYQGRLWPELRYIHDCIHSGAWGAIRSFCAYQQEGWRARNLGTWRQQPEIAGGGNLHDGGSHLLDDVLWTTGIVPLRISAIQDFAGTPVDVNTMISVECDSDSAGTFTLMGDIPGFSQRIIIACDRAMVTYGHNVGLHVQRPDGSIEQVPRKKMPAGSNVINNFFDAIQHKTPIAAPFECALPVARLTEAACASAASNGAPVSF